MAVGKGSILRAANAAGTEREEQNSGRVEKTPKTSEIPVKESEGAAPQKTERKGENAKGQAITSLKDIMPVYLL